MKSIDVIGKTVDEALEKALNQLNVTKDKVEVDIIDEGYRGLFKFIGGKPAKIKVTLKADYKDEAREFLNNILRCMNVNADVNINDDKDSVYIELLGEKMGSVIGYRGETLDALQYLVSLVINKNHEQPYRRVILDAENYRKKREETLKRVAEKTAYKVRKSRRSFKLEPMNPYERRIIHSALQNYVDIKTFSEGEEPFRRIVVDIKRN
ncbi:MULTISPECIES: RNA-binding cell elongation regulator Jag/EloR [Clostridium]|uniref:RNA-binding protein KhpB n=1 Tax=Clostridium cibarium TaxID=2762247 RepID=A0ABR8PY43_9CLOT|nr:MULTISPECIES: RNA-binding cell elongation regulator Jag/EloR [Clostridium]MBD7913091.1 protein jag [Clostridium cibarium]